MHYLGVRDRKREKLEKKAKINLCTLVLFSVIHLVVLIGIHNLKTLVQLEAEQSVTENFVREKEKWTNKGTDKQHVATQYNLSLPSFVPNIKILGQVVPEKSLTEKKLYRQTNICTEKAKTIYPLYRYNYEDIIQRKHFVD